MHRPSVSQFNRNAIKRIMPVFGTEPLEDARHVLWTQDFIQNRRHWVPDVVIISVLKEQDVFSTPDQQSDWVPDLVVRKLAEVLRPNELLNRKGVV